MAGGERGAGSCREGKAHSPWAIESGSRGGAGPGVLRVEMVLTLRP